MAGEPILRSAIETNIAKYLDRADDPVITDIVGTWFSQAHRKAQRLFNFSFMEGIDSVGSLIENGAAYTVSFLVKEAVRAEVVNISTLDTLRKYKKTDIDTVERYRADGGYSGAVFSIEGRTYHLWPPTTQVNVNLRFNVHGYMFQPTPIPAGNDWLTDFGSDFLMYQSLLESVDYVSAPEGRLMAWQSRATEAFTDLISMDTQYKIAGPLALR